MATHDFREWRLPQLLAMVPKDPHAQVAEHLDSWQRQADLLQEQSRQLKQLRADLEAKWPPDKSDAARGFVFRISNMIDAMDRTVDASGQIRGALNEIAEAMKEARAKLDALRTRYADKQAAWQAFNKRMMMMPGLPDNLVPSIPIFPGAEHLAITTYQQQLDAHAREIMRAADKRVTEANTKVSTADLPDYGPFGGPGEREPSDPRAGEGKPDASPMRQARSGGSLATPAVPPPRFDPATLPALPGEDPVLAGGPSSAGPVTGPGGPALPGAGSGVVPSVMPGAGSFLWRTGSGDPVLRPGGVIGGAEPDVRQGGVRPGGVIGGQPAGSASVFGGGVPPTASRVRPASRGAYEGRVLGEPRDGTVSPLPGAGGWRDTQYEDYARRRRRPNEADPDNPWAVEEGVPPVLDAPDEPQFIVGPGVIGLDR